MNERTMTSVAIKSYRMFSLDGVKGDFIALEPDASRDIADPETDVAIFYSERRHKKNRAVCVWKNVKYYYFSATNNHYLISTTPIDDS
jgi:hypothetical protein